MQRLDEVIDYYITTDTNYAIMITGDWGVGKTYYFKNILAKQISETPTFNDNQTKYKPIYISLFGLKSIEEIQSEIFLLLYPFLKNKAVKLGATLGKSIIKGILHLKNLGQYDDYVSSIENEKGEWIKFSELVLCFDDLERLSKDFNIEEFIGYINSLVENENVKIILIANENKIDEKNYYALKEKIVGNSIEFIPDFNLSYDSLIDKMFIGYQTYKTYLTENKKIITEIFTKESKNLRTLSFALSYFHRIFSLIKKDLPTDVILKGKEKEILETLLRFTLSISIEYKEGNISFTRLENLDSDNRIDWSNIQFEDLRPEKKNNTESEEKVIYKELFFKKYYDRVRYFYFKSVYHFLTGGSILKYTDLVNEIKAFYNIEEDKVLPQYEIFNKLNSNLFSLSSSEYNSLIREMLEYSDKGKYNIINYPSIFFFATRFENPLGFNLKKLEKRIIRGMKNGRASFIYNRALDFYFNIDSNAENKIHLINIRDAALDLNQEIEKGNVISDVKRLEEICFSNLDLFYSEILDIDKPYLYNPIFHLFNPHKFYIYFIKSSNETKWKIILLFRNRYKGNTSRNLISELDFLNILKHKIEKKSNKISKKGLIGYIFNEFNNNLELTIDELNKLK